MKKRFFLWGITLVVLFVSCDIIPEIKTKEDRPLAKVYDKVLYFSEVEVLLKDNASTSDSIQLFDSYTSNWIKKQLFLRKAEFNLQDDEINDFESLVEDYRTTLYINAYKEGVINNKLDTVITSQQVDEYYQINAETFRLNEDLIRFRFIQFSLDNLSDEQELNRLIRSNDNKDFVELKNRELEFKSSHLNDSVWVRTLDLPLIVNSKLISKEGINRTGTYRFQDSVNVDLISILELKKRGEVAPKSYVSQTVKQIILHKRKLNLLRDLEEDLLDDAIKNGKFEKY